MVRTSGELERHHNADMFRPYFVPYSMFWSKSAVICRWLSRECWEMLAWVDSDTFFMVGPISQSAVATLSQQPIRKSRFPLLSKQLECAIDGQNDCSLRKE